jgi:hypothetical protein
MTGSSQFTSEVVWKIDILPKRMKSNVEYDISQIHTPWGRCLLPREIQVIIGR